MPSKLRNTICDKKFPFICKIVSRLLTCFSHQDYQTIEMDCPDGLNYNPEAKWPNYPCSYPQDVPCEGRKSRREFKCTSLLSILHYSKGISFF